MSLKSGSILSFLWIQWFFSQKLHKLKNIFSKGLQYIDLFQNAQLWNDRPILHHFFEVWKINLYHIFFITFGLEFRKSTHFATHRSILQWSTHSAKDEGIIVIIIKIDYICDYFSQCNEFCGLWCMALSSCLWRDYVSLFSCWSLLSFSYLLIGSKSFFAPDWLLRMTLSKFLPAFDPSCAKHNFYKFLLQWNRDFHG